MADNIIAKLIESFERFPGIGPRQARRFVYHLVDEPPKVLSDLSESITRLSKEVSRCSECFRIFQGRSPLCSICADGSRDDSKLLILEKDADLENLERSQVYSGKYHILGGLISPLRPELQERLRFKELYRKLEKKAGINEVVLALSATTEGDMTRRYIEKIMEPLVRSRALKISNLGRGLSTGTELEYSDRETLKHAFENRK